jgi:L-fuconate dehydratase
MKVLTGMIDILHMSLLRVGLVRYLKIPMNSISLIVVVATGYSDEKVARLTKEALAAGFNHFKMKVGANVEDDLRRGSLIRSIIDDPQYVVVKHDPQSKELQGKNAGPTGSVLMIDANQVWDVKQAIDYVTKLETIRPW